MVESGTETESDAGSQSRKSQCITNTWGLEHWLDEVIARKVHSRGSLTYSSEAFREVYETDHGLADESGGSFYPFS